MRTDSTTLSDQALSAARAQATAMYGPRVRAGRPPPVQQEGQERPGGPRGHPPGGGVLPHPGRGGPLAVGRRAPALRPDLEAHRRLPDGRRHRHQRPGPADRDGDRATARRRAVEFGASGTVIEFPGFQRAYVEGEDDPEAELADREVRLPPMAEGDPARLSGRGAGRSRHPAAGPLHRGVAGQGDGGDRRGAALHLRQHRLDHPRPGLRLEEGLGHGALADRLRRGRPARAALRRPGRLRADGLDGGRPRRDRRR